MTDIDRIRLQKALAHAGVASRRASEELIVRGKVKVNGKIVTELGTRVDPKKDRVEVSGRLIQLDNDKVYLAFHKPVGVISSMYDDRDRADLGSFFNSAERVFNVGRLDADTSGLLLMTNDGELANQLMHPSYEVEKLYRARIRGEITPATIKKLTTGISLDDGESAADRAKILDVSGNHSLVEIVLHSGKNRIVRRMLDAVGHPVTDLARRSFGPVRLGTLKPGDSRQLGKLEISSLMEAGTKK